VDRRRVARRSLRASGEATVGIERRGQVPRGRDPRAIGTSEPPPLRLLGGARPGSETRRAETDGEGRAAGRGPSCVAASAGSGQGAPVLAHEPSRHGRFLSPTLAEHWGGGVSYRGSARRLFACHRPFPGGSVLAQVAGRCVSALTLALAASPLVSFAPAPRSTTPTALDVSCGPILFVCGGRQCSWSLDVTCLESPVACICWVDFTIDCGVARCTRYAPRTCEESSPVQCDLCDKQVRPEDGESWGSVSNCAGVELEDQP
jgi:hypothetical protein